MISWGRWEGGGEASGQQYDGRKIATKNTTQNDEVGVKMAPAIENDDPPHGMHAPRSRQKRARGRDNTRGGGDKEMLRWSEEEESPTFLGGWTGVDWLG